MLYEKLKEYAASGAYPMHMPGHKRNADLMPPGLPYEIDITEIHGFDDLHCPNGLLLETAETAAELYGSSGTFILINGSTVGIVAAIGAHAKRGDKILAADNSHRSIPNSAELFGLDLVKITLETDETTGVPCSVIPTDIETALKKDPEIKLVVITSPTYEGVVSDIGSIAEIVHDRGTPLLVDAAHGAHLGFSGAFPDSAVSAGADVVVMSLHKTLPALTQCSLLHVCGERVNIAGIKKLLSILQTSSPSYVLMASIDHCLRLLKTDSGRLFSEYERKLTRFYDSVNELKKLSVLSGQTAPLAQTPGFYDLDPGKIVIVTKNTGISGFELADTMRTQYKIELERACADYAIAMTSISDSTEGFTRLADALREFDRKL